MLRFLGIHLKLQDVKQIEDKMYIILSENMNTHEKHMLPIIYTDKDMVYKEAERRDDQGANIYIHWVCELVVLEIQ